MTDAIESLRRRFQSGNDVPVPQAKITAAEYAQLVSDRAAMAAAVVALEAAFCEPTYSRQIAAYKRFNRDHAPAIALAREVCGE